RRWMRRRSPACVPRMSRVSATARRQRNAPTTTGSRTARLVMTVDLVEIRSTRIRNWDRIHYWTITIRVSATAGRSTLRTTLSPVLTCRGSHDNRGDEVYRAGAVRVFHRPAVPLEVEGPFQGQQLPGLLADLKPHRLPGPLEPGQLGGLGLAGRWRAGVS